MSLRIRRSRAARLAAGLFLSAFGLAAGFQSRAQQGSVSAWITLGDRSALVMSAADANRLRAQRGAVAEESTFFGYDLSLPGWRYTQAVCPEIPDYLILHYRRTSRNDAQSLFTALVPRRSGRVQVIPVLYRNATPFRSAVDSERSFSVFNRVVPSSVAEKDLQPEASWLELALCYAEIAGAEPRVLREMDTNAALLRAPAPALQVSEVNHTANVLFTDRSAQHSYTVWNVTFDSHGRVMAATAITLSDYVARVLSGKPPKGKPFPSGAQPKVIPMPPVAAPKTKPVPQ